MNTTDSPVPAAGDTIAARVDRPLDLPVISILLVIETLYLFVLTPMTGADMLGLGWLTVGSLATAVASLAATAPGRKTRWAVWLTFLGSTAAPLVVAIDTHSLLLRCISIALGGLFTLTVTAVIARAVFTASEISVAQIEGAIVIYLNVAVLFVTAYGLLMTFIPDAFRNLTAAPNQFPTTLYLSLGYLTTAGAGDITPLHPLARSLVNLESVFGQLFIATLLARLVSLHAGSQR